MKSPIRFLGSATLLLLGANLGFAQQPTQPAPDKAAEKPKEEKKPPTPEEKIVQTKHSLKIAGQEIKYTATAGTLTWSGDASPRTIAVPVVADGPVEVRARLTVA